MVRLRPLLPVAAIAASLLAPAGAGATDARLVGTFTLTGRVTVADHVRGEHRGQRVRRRWTFASSCAQGPCRTVRLRRRRGGGRSELVRLHRVGADRYAGHGRFYTALLCHGRRYPRGGVVPYRLAIRVRGFRRVQSTAFGTRISARYRNLRRVNRTPCPGSIGHDAARYSGRLAGRVPSPPTAAFTFGRTAPLSPTFAFADESRPGAGGARIVAQTWNFGDPSSGTANQATGPGPTHTFASAGPHTVALIVRDANGLTGAAQHAVTP